MRVCVILGTRPEIVEFSPIIREFEHENLGYFILHTGQHYSYNMDRIFLKQLDLPNVKYNLDVGSGTHGQQTGKMKRALIQTTSGVATYTYTVTSSAEYDFVATVHIGP